MVYSAESGSEGSSDASDENTNHQVCNITTSTLYILLNGKEVGYKAFGIQLRIPLHM